MLITVGFGADRFNTVTDASSLRAVAELTKLNGFLGRFDFYKLKCFFFFCIHSVSIDKNSAPYKLYRSCLDTIYKHQTFRSVLAASICCATCGEHGYFIPLEVS